ncbi:hypothetical protein CULT_130067 [[Clostridium] ultunense Esp]|nr:hypothetical protein CULT_130067 [[Clostridium] ultunense Esp]
MRFMGIAMIAGKKGSFNARWHRRASILVIPPFLPFIRFFRPFCGFQVLRICFLVRKLHVLPRSEGHFFFRVLFHSFSSSFYEHSGYESIFPFVPRVQTPYRELPMAYFFILITHYRRITLKIRCFDERDAHDQKTWGGCHLRHRAHPLYHGFGKFDARSHPSHHEREASPVPIPGQFNHNRLFSGGGLNHPVGGISFGPVWA